MAEASPRPVLRSLLDRLVDAEPERSSDPPIAHAQLLREHRESVVRDLANLLNTRRRSPPPPEELTDLVPSMADYGIRDFLGDNLASPEAREALRASIESAIRRYEPRFLRVSVRIWEFDETAGDASIRIRIEAMLHADPAPITVAFDSVLDPLTGGFDVEGGKP